MMHTAIDGSKRYQSLHAKNRNTWPSSSACCMNAAGNYRNTIATSTRPICANTFAWAPLIEVRSCERFGVLADNCDDPALAKLYSGLYASELGHYHIFIELARGLPGATEVESRWNEWLDIEANVIGAQAPTSSMHSGVKMG